MHRAEQQPAEAGQRIDRQHEVAEGDAPGRGDRAGVPHLQLGEQHPARRYRRRLRSRGWRTTSRRCCRRGGQRRGGGARRRARAAAGQPRTPRRSTTSSRTCGPAGSTARPTRSASTPTAASGWRSSPARCPLPPYPAWAQSDESLASVARLLRRYHDAAAGYRRTGRARRGARRWPTRRPARRRVVCHNDVCLENVVFRDGIAVALLDFDFAAPGRPAYDLSQFARMCVPIDDESRVALRLAPGRPRRAAAPRRRRLRPVAGAATRSVRRAGGRHRARRRVRPPAGGGRRRQLHRDVGVHGRPRRRFRPPAGVVRPTPHAGPGSANPSAPTRTTQPLRAVRSRAERRRSGPCPRSTAAASASPTT